MSEFNELTEEEIFALLSFEERHQLGINPNLQQIAEALVRFIPNEYFSYYQSLVAAALPEFAETLRPAQINLKKIKDLSPITLQRLFNIPDAALAYRAVTALDLETQNIILSNISKKNRQALEEYKAQNPRISLEDSTLALAEITEPLRMYLAKLGYLNS